MFELKPMDPALYRRQTRRSTLIIAASFAALGVLLSSVAVSQFGQRGGDNFRLNLAGVLVALLLTLALVRYNFWSRPWMAAAVYGWRLKRSLMSVTNVMHNVHAGVVARDPVAIKLLRFYHLGLTQMHQLDGNSGAHSQSQRDSEHHRALMIDLGFDAEQLRLDPAWLQAVKQHAAIK